MSNCKIQLRPVGKLPNSNKCLNSKRSSFAPERQYDRFEGEVTPSYLSSEEDKEEKELFKPKRFQMGKRKREEKEQFKFNLIQDPRESQFSYRKYLLIEKMLLILAIFSFFVAVINTQMYVVEEISNSTTHQFTLEVDKISSLMTLLLIVATLMRYVCINELEIDQKKYYCIRIGRGIFHELLRFFKRNENVKYFIIEFLLILPHSFFLFHDYQIEILETYDKMMLKHRVNDILTIASLSRIYIVMRSMINLTLYSTPRASRLCSHNRVEHSLLYTVKCLLKQEPVKIITLVFLINEITLGFGLRLSEGSLVYNNPQLSNTGFENYINCYWCVFITMATVGYGDYYPKTMPGRMFGIFAAASGIILSSLLIVSLSAYLTMQANQSKSHLTLVRLQHQQRLKQEATQALIETMRMTKYLSSQEKSNDNRIKDFFTTLKHKIDLVKFRTRKIKSLVNNSNIIEEMNRLFELFKDNLQESFRNQVLLKESLEKLNKKSGAAERKMQTIFLTHNMEEIISKKL